MINQRYSVRRMKEGEMGKGSQLYDEGWKPDLSCKHAIVYINAEL